MLAWSTNGATALLVGTSVERLGMLTISKITAAAATTDPQPRMRLRWFRTAAMAAAARSSASRAAMMRQRNPEGAVIVHRLRSRCESLTAITVLVLTTMWSIGDNDVYGCIVNPL